MAEYKVITIACLCGRNAFSTSVPHSSLPLPATVCHCYGCRHVYGNLGNPSIQWPSTTLPDFGGLIGFDFSEMVRIFFCGTCGTFMFRHKHDGTESTAGIPVNQDTTRLSVMTGILDQPDETVAVVQHICVQGTRDGGGADFLPVVDNRPLPRWKTIPNPAPKDLSGLLPIGWRLESSNLSNREPQTTLKAHCLCKGVEFYITRPSAIKVDGVEEGEEWWRYSGDRFPAGCCVCKSCRFASGGDVMHWSFVPKENIKLMDGSDFTLDFGTMKSYRSSDEASRQFCSRCGCTVLYSADGRKGLVDVAVGMFACPSGARAEEWLAWRSWRVSWENDTVHTRVRDALKAGLKAWGEKQSEGSYQNLAKEPSLVAFKKLLAATKCDE